MCKRTEESGKEARNQNKSSTEGWRGERNKVENETRRYLHSYNPGRNKIMLTKQSYPNTQKWKNNPKVKVNIIT